MKVSIIMPVYNGEKYIRYSIESLLNQTFQDFELLIVDDCSIDNTKEIIYDYLNKDNRIKYFKTNKNSGSHYARNLGIKNSQSDYICFCDADDICDKTKIEKQYKFLKDNPEVKAVTTYAIYKDETMNQEVSKFILPLDYNEIKEQIYICNIFPIAFAMCKKEALLKINCFNEKIKFSDYFVAIKLIENFKVAIIPEFLYYIRNHSTSLSIKLNDDMHYVFFQSLKLVKGFDSILKTLDWHKKNVYRYLKKYITNKKVYIYGTGKGAKILNELLLENNFEIESFIDSYKKDGLINGIKVINYKDVKIDNYDYIILIASVYVEEILNNLKRINVSDKFFICSNIIVSLISNNKVRNQINIQNEK